MKVTGGNKQEQKKWKDAVSSWTKTTKQRGTWLWQITR